MGQVVSKIYGSTLRQAKMYNIEQRAEKVISRDKPIRAPLNPSAAKELERLKEGNVSTDYLYKKDQTLNDYLKKVYVTTPDPVPPKLENPVRPLPRARHHREEMSYGYCEIEEERVPEGKVSLKQALEFIVAHHTDPVTYSSAAISQQYQIDPKLASDVLEHFKMFNVHVQKKGVNLDSLSKEEKLDMRVQSMSMLNASEIVKELNLNSRFKKYKDKLFSSSDKTNLDTTQSDKENKSSKNDSKDNT